MHLSWHCGHYEISSSTAAHRVLSNGGWAAHGRIKEWATWAVVVQAPPREGNLRTFREKKPEQLLFFVRNSTKTPCLKMHPFNLQT